MTKKILAIVFAFSCFDSDILLDAIAHAELAPANSGKRIGSGKSRRGVRARNRKSGGGTRSVSTTLSDFCEKDFKVVYSEGKSDSKTCSFKIGKDFKEAFETTFRQCLDESSETMGWGKPSSIRILHDGCYNPRNARGSRQRSAHATARALDIKSIELQFPDSKPPKDDENILFTRRTDNPKFYSLVRDCWGKRNLCNRSIGFPGSGKAENGVNNDLHNDHLHISKTCPPQLGGHSVY